MKFYNKIHVVGQSDSDLKIDGVVHMTGLSSLNDSTCISINPAGKLGLKEITLGNLGGTVPVTGGGTGLSTMGSALQLLRVNAAGDEVEWYTPGASGLDWTVSQTDNIHVDNYNNTQLSQEQVEDFAGAMFDSNVTTGPISSYYNDDTGKVDITSTALPIAGGTLTGGLTISSGGLDASGISTFSSQINAGYGVKFTNGDTDFLLYNNSGEDVLYMRDTTNGAMITTWGVNDFTVNKNLIGTTATFTDSDGSVAISGGNINLTDSGGGNMIILDSSSGDGIVRWEDNNVPKWDIGRDNTDNAFVIANEPGLDDNQVLHLNHSTGDATFGGNVTVGSNSLTAGSLDINGAADISGILTQGDHIEIGSGKRIRWGAGDALIQEGVAENYALEFQTYDGSSMTEALRLSGDNTATFTGDVILSGTAPTLKIQDSRNLNNPDWDDVSLGNIEFYSSDTTSPGARVLAEVEAFSNAGAASGPNAELRFKTSKISDSSPQTRLTIDHNGDATFTNNIVVSGTVDGRDLASDGTTIEAHAAKLEGIDDNANNYTLPEAAHNALGGIKVSSTVTSVEPTDITSTAGRSYSVQKNSNGVASVNVPWTDNDNNTTYTLSAQDGPSISKEIIRLSDNGEGTNDITLEAGDGLTIGRSGNTIKFDSQSTIVDATDETKGKVELATVSEATTGTDTSRATTAAGVKAHVDSRYSIQYITMHGQAIVGADEADIWFFPKDVGGIEYFKFEDATDSVSVDTTSFALPRGSQHKGIHIPHTCKLVGYTAISSCSGNAQARSSLWYYQPRYGEAGSSGTTCYRSHYAEADLTISSGNEQEWESSSNYTTRPAFHNAKDGSTDNTNLEIDLNAGYAILPAITGASAGTHRVTFTIILKVPIV